ncbi:Gfo/Idh/MocA family protein [Kineococcus sp. SYSU DK002]|uniref:Gfo/Idh/MocA family protein n=1 Tax=Kineococcus sp. SYSU DK002 TaxID=3383123 RepID=UPI003D7D9577
MTWGVGIIGAGPGVAALHAPVLARTGGTFRLAHVADAGSGRAAAIAQAFGARASTGTADLLADPEVDVVAVCSPPALHAGQVLDAVAAGKRAVFCEKPLATTAGDARRAVGACAEAGVALVVGTNHLFDPAWARAKHHVDALREPVVAVTATLALAPNSRYHAVVSGAAPRAGGGSGGRPPLDLSVAAVRAGLVRQLVVGLAVHDLPLVRDLLPAPQRVEHARAVAPLGLDLVLRAGSALVRFSAVMVAEGADTLWRLTVHTAGDRVEVEFPPPFVHAGSARVSVRDAAGRCTRYPVEPVDGYVAEWTALADLLRGGHGAEYAEVLADAEQVVAIADAAERFVLDGASA